MEREYTRTFRVRAFDRTVGPIEVMFAPGVPRIGDFYQSFRANEVDEYALCRRVRPAQDDDDWTTWTVTVEYSTEGGNPQSIPEHPGQPGGTGGGSGQAGDPTLDPPTVEWGQTGLEGPIALLKDLGDKDAEEVEERTPRPFLNSAGQPFEPPPARQDDITTVTVERNEVSYDLLRARQFRNTCNADVFLGYAPGLWLLKSYTGRVVFKGPYKYARCRYEFWLAPVIDMRNTWDKLYLLDAGLCRLGPDGKTAVPIIQNGHPISSPALLHGGLPLSKEDIANPAIGPQYLRFTVRKREAFSNLKIETLIL